MARTERRLFFALWPEKELRQGLERLIRSLPEHRGRTTHLLDLHATLVFLGDVGEERLACVERAARGVTARPFDLVIDRAGYWARPRILWCGPGRTPEPLSGLVRELNEGLIDCGFEPERRSYAAHITLARKARYVSGFTLEQPLAWPVRDFVLVASRMGAEPPRYQVVARWPLEGT